MWANHVVLLKRCHFVNMRRHNETVFGQVVEGMDVVRRIEKAPTGTKGPYRDVPVEDILIVSVEIQKP